MIENHKPTSHNQPLVSVGMPVYNGEAFICQALDSLLTQDYPNLELIISDNASTDATQTICLEYAHKDQRIGYCRQDVNLGSIENFNRVFELSSGKYFLWASDHDLRHPSFISRCIGILEKDPSVVLCYPRAAWLGMDNQVRDVIPRPLDTRGLSRPARFQTVIWNLGYCYQIYGVHRSSALRGTGLNRHILGPDMVLLAELSLLGAFAFVPDLLFYVRRLGSVRDWHSYFMKINRQLSLSSAPLLFGELIWSHLAVINRHVQSPVERFALLASALLCMPIRYYRYFFSLVKASFRRQGPGQDGGQSQVAG